MNDNTACAAVASSIGTSNVWLIWRNVSWSTATRSTVGDAASTATGSSVGKSAPLVGTASATENQFVPVATPSSVAGARAPPAPVITLPPEAAAAVIATGCL